MSTGQPAFRDLLCLSLSPLDPSLAIHCESMTNCFSCIMGSYIKIIHHFQDSILKSFKPHKLYSKRQSYDECYNNNKLTHFIWENKEKCLGFKCNIWFTRDYSGIMYSLHRFITIFRVFSIQEICMERLQLQFIWLYLQANTPRNDVISWILVNGNFINARFTNESFRNVDPAIGKQSSTSIPADLQ